MRHLPSIYKFCYYNRYVPEISCTLLLLMQLQLWLVAKNGFIAMRKNDKLLLQIISYHDNMLRRSQPQNSCIYAHFVHTDNNCTLLSEHRYGNTGCWNHSSRMSKPSTPIWYHTRKSGGSDRLSTATFYEPDWQSYVSGVKEQGCWFPTWPFTVYRSILLISANYLNTEGASSKISHQLRTLHVAATSAYKPSNTLFLIYPYFIP